MSNPPFKDQALRNLTVSGILTVGGRQVSNNSVIGNATIANAEIGDATIINADIHNLFNDSVDNATLNNGLQFDDLQKFVGFSSNTSGDPTLAPLQAQRGVVSSSNHQNFLLSNIIAQVFTPGPIPTFVSTRKVTFNNMTSTTLDIYVTEGYPNAHAPTIIPGGAAFAPGATPVEWDIPATAGWNGNFTVYPTGATVMSGSTLAEFGFNQFWHGATPATRETCDLSTVPPGIGTKCNDGPRETCVNISRQSGFSTQQSFGYNVGMRLTPPTSIILPFAIVTCTAANGDSAGSIGYPNDTAFPKQQTIDYISTEGYTIDLLDPVRFLP